MKTLTQTFAKRALSILLVTIMVFSLGITGIVSTSAAETELAETGGWGDGSDNFQLLNEVDGIWSTNASVKMTPDGGNNMFEYAIKGISTSSPFEFRVWDARYSQNIGPSSDNYGITPSIGESLYDVTVSSANDNKDYNWVFKFDNLKNNYSYVDIYVQFYISYNNSNKLRIWVSDASSSGTGVHLRGDYSGGVQTWGKFDTKANMMALSTTNTYTKTLTLSKGMHYFLIYVDNVKCGAMNESKTIYDSCTNWQCWNQYDKDIAFYAEGGTYKFTYNKSTNKLTIENQSQSFNSTVDWNHSLDNSTSWSTNRMTHVSGSKVYTLDYKVSGASTIVFDFILNKDTANELTLMRDTTSVQSVSFGTSYAVDGYGQNLKISPQTAGTMHIELNLSTKKFVITFTADVVVTYDINASCTDADVTIGDNIVINASAGVTGATASSISYKLYEAASASATTGTDITNESYVTKSGGTSAYTFTINSADFAAGTKYYYVVASFVVNESTHTEKSDNITVTVNAPVVPDDALSVTASGQPTYAGNTTTITAKATVTGTVTDIQYTLYANDRATVVGAVQASGTFSVTLPSDATGTVTYYVKATGTDSDGNAIESDFTAVTITVTDTPDYIGTQTVTIYFKSAESYGYVPKISFDGTNYQAMTKGSVIWHNDTNTGHYYWYKAETTTTDGAPINFSVTSERFFKECSATLDITKSVGDNGFNYYFAMENLNDPAGKVIDVTSNQYKDVTLSVVNMIVDEADNYTTAELVATTACYRAVAIGDANDDGKVNVRDATAIQKDLAKYTELTEVGTVVSDVNGDGKVTIKDATAVQKQIAGL